MSLLDQVKEDTISRIERFSNLTGGDCIAIAFLLSTVDGEEQVLLSGMHALASLQVLYAAAFHQASQQSLYTRSTASHY